MFEDSLHYFPVFQIVDFEGTQGDIASKEKKLLEFISDYKTAAFTDSKNEKKAKVLFKDTHQQYFKKYQLEALFKQIFTDGVYNCATASAVFAIIFEELNLEYEIRLLPDHVYLILFPKTEAIKIETTNPMRGYLNIDEKAKREYVKFLRDNKLVSEEEFNTKSAVELFDEYYFKDIVINIRQLIGVQYYNFALGLFNQQKWEESFREFEKAKVFFDDARVDFLLYASLSNYLSTRNKVDEGDLMYLVKLTNYNLIESSVKNFTAYYGLFLQQHLFEKGEENHVTSTFNFIVQHLNDSVVISETSFTHYYETGRYYINKGNFEKSNTYFEQALDLKPKSVDAQSAFIETLVYCLDNMPFEESVKKIEELAEKYPDLKTNLKFAGLVGNAYLFNAIQLFNNKKVSEGLMKIEAFEQHFSAYDGLAVNSDIIGEAYTTAAVGFFAKGQYSKAKEMINRGLTIAPNNYELNRALNSF